MAKKVEELEKMRKRRAKRNTIANEKGEDAFSFFFAKPTKDKADGSNTPRL